MSTDELKKEAVDTLRRVLDEQQEWVKVHAAEFLTWTGNTEGVKEVYLKELEQHENNSPYRIGIWRVLAQLSSGSERTEYEQKIFSAFLDTGGKDRIHAAETLGKLKKSPYSIAPAISAAALNSDVVALKGYANWALAYTSDSAMEKARTFFLQTMREPNTDMVLRKISAYALRYTGGIREADWNKLADEVFSLPDGADGSINFLTTLVITADETIIASEKYKAACKTLLSNTTEKSKAVRIEIANALAEKGGESDLPLLKQWLHNEDSIGVAADDADVQASAAYAILKITGR